MSEALYVWTGHPKEGRHELRRAGQLVAVVTHDGPCGTWGNAVTGPDGTEVSSAEPMTFGEATVDAKRTAEGLWDPKPQKPAKMPPEKTIRRYRQQAPMEFAQGASYYRADGAESGNPYPTTSLEGRAWRTGYRTARAEKERGA